MDINARINWRPGMELTTQTFLDMDENLDFRQQTAIRAALGDHCIGLLPDMPFDNSGMFYTNRYEMQRERFLLRRKTSTMSVRSIHTLSWG